MELAQSYEQDKGHPSSLPHLPETVILLKSAVMFSTPSTRLHFHVFTESELQPKFRDALESWPSFVRERFSYSLRSITYPGIYTLNYFDQQKTQFRSLDAPLEALVHVIARGTEV